MSEGPLLQVTDLVKEFPIRAGVLLRAVGSVKAVSGVSFSVDRHQTLGVVGESGCGKSTVGRTVLGLLPATSGSVRFDGVELVGLGSRELRRMRRRVQMVFQDPYASLNPRMTVAAIVREPMQIHHLNKGREINRVKDLKIRDAKIEQRRAVTTARSTVQILAIAIPALVLVLLIIIVFVNRLAAERSHVPASRKRA